MRATGSLPLARRDVQRDRSAPCDELLSRLRSLRSSRLPLHGQKNRAQHAEDRLVSMPLRLRVVAACKLFFGRVHLSIGDVFDLFGRAIVVHGVTTFP